MRKKLSGAKRIAQLITDAARQGEKRRVNTGDKVMLDVDRIIRRREWDVLQEAYRQFVMENAGRIFTARVYTRGRDGRYSPLIELSEEPMWLFWEGDLIVVRNGGDEDR